MNRKNAPKHKLRSFRSLSFSPLCSFYLTCQKSSQSQSYHSSDEVQAANVGSEVGVRNGYCLSPISLSPISNQICQAVCVLDWRGHLNRPRHVVIVVAKFVGQLLNLLLRLLDRIVHDNVVRGWDQSLPTHRRNQEEIVGVRTHHLGVDDGSGGRIANGVRIFSVKESLVDPLIAQDDHQFDWHVFGCHRIFTPRNFANCSLKLRQFVHQHRLLLTVTDSIAINYHILRQNSIFVLKGSQSFSEENLERIWDFLPLVLLFSPRPILRGSLVIRRSEG